MTATQMTTPATVNVINDGASARVMLVCEHASNTVPTDYDLGISEEVRRSHVGWDIGAFGVAERLSELMDARLIAGGVSRLIYDCNRPIDALDAMPAISEVYDIPGNQNLSQAQRLQRIKQIYIPFRDTLAGHLAAVGNPILVTIHSFTPVYLGTPRSIDIGILHDTDARLADCMLQLAGTHTSLKIARNQPYGPSDGVTHTLTEHGIAQGIPNVMIELRNDLITTPAQQDALARMLSDWLGAAVARLRQQDPAC